MSINITYLLLQHMGASGVPKRVDNIKDLIRVYGGFHPVTVQVDVKQVDVKQVDFKKVDFEKVDFKKVVNITDLLRVRMNSHHL